MNNPIYPIEVIKLKRKLPIIEESIPDNIIEVFNELIIKYWNGYRSKVFQKEVIKILSDKYCVSHSSFFDSLGAQKIKSTFEAVGWDVEYDDALDNSYDAYFYFWAKWLKV